MPDCPTCPHTTNAHGPNGCQLMVCTCTEPREETQ